MAEVNPHGACVSASGAASVQSLEGSEAVRGASSLKAATTLTTGRLDDLQLAIERVYLGRDVEDTSVGLMVPRDFC